MKNGLDDVLYCGGEGGELPHNWINVLLLSMTGSLSTYTNNILAKTRKSYKHIAPRMETTR